MTCTQCPMKTKHTHTSRPLAVPHTCEGRDCPKRVTFTRLVYLDGGAVRHEGIRHDGSAIAVVDPVETDLDDVLPEAEQCTYLVHAGSRWGDAPEPPEYCDEDAVDGSELCERHGGFDEGPDPDEQHDRERDDAL